MPKIERKGNFEGKVTKAVVEGDTCQLKMTVETADREHGYPVAWLLNKDGTENDETVRYLVGLTGWDKEDTDNLCRLLLGKTIQFYSKCKSVGDKEYWNYYISTGKSKPVDTTSARAAWAAAHGKDVPAPSAAPANLDISDAEIPF